MADQQPNPNPPSPPPPPPPPPPGPASALPRYPNPPETGIPDPTTLRDQWRFAIRQYSRWYSQAWGTAILAGGAFFALGWYIKGSNPLPSRITGHKTDQHPAEAPPGDADGRTDR